VWRDVGIAVAIGPVLWTLAGCVVTVVVFTLADRWTMEGQVFRSAGYYRSLIVAWAPWLVGGGAVLLWSRHVEEPG
jgi:hypothetical protein